jgi:hypothetical protein
LALALAAMEWVEAEAPADVKAAWAYWLAMLQAQPEAARWSFGFRPLAGALVDPESAGPLS